MPKNIVVFADGTGQAGGLPGAVPTNVYKLFRACPVVPGVQETFYDPGLGSPPDGTRLGRWRRLYNLVSRVTGLGISRNIADCYDALIRMYEPGDRIYLFGFSRGAYTVRSLGGVLSICGIPRCSPHGLDLRTNKRARRRAVRWAIRWVYQTHGRSTFKTRLRQRRGKRFRERHDSDPHHVQPYFIGAWDCVRAIGIPGLSWLVFWRHAFHDAALDARVPYARQVLSIDENRSLFAPELWHELPDDGTSGRIKQVWLPGVHSDIGGGYRECELSDLSLEWLVREAVAIPHPLIVDKSLLGLRPSHRGVQHDERIGWGLLWIKGTRERLRIETLLLESSVSRRVDELSVPTIHGEMPYRPALLARHPEFSRYYRAIAARQHGLFQRLRSVLSQKTK